MVDEADMKPFCVDKTLLLLNRELVVVTAAPVDDTTTFFGLPGTFPLVNEVPG